VPEAIQHYQQALRLNPNDAANHTNLGIALEHEGKTREAIEHYRQALRLQPDLVEAHNDLAMALVQLGQFQEAIDHWQRALQIKPDFAKAHYNLGMAFAQSGRMRDAMDQWELALRFQPDFPEPHYDLGAALEQIGRFQNAIRHYEQALRMKPNYLGALNNLAWLFATLAPTDGGNPARAVTLAEKACRLTNNRLAAYLDTLAAAYAAAGRFPDAIAAAQKAIELANSTRQPELVKGMETRLQLYRGGRPYRRTNTVPSSVNP